MRHFDNRDRRAYIFGKTSKEFRLKYLKVWLSSKLLRHGIFIK